MNELKRLFEPINIKGIEIRNRIKMAPLALGYAEDGFTGDRFKNFFEERAKGGVGLIDFALWPSRTETGFYPWIYDDEFIPGLRKVTEAVHAHGAKIIGQLGTGYTWSFGDGPVELIGPSGISLITRPGSVFRVGGTTNPERLEERAVTIDEIHQLVEAYGDAGRRIREAGFDGVEFMTGAGYMISRFISPLTNKRTDEYGGSLEKRMRFFAEICEDTRKKAGADFPIFCKISGSQFVEGGYTLEDCANEIVPMMEEMGICAIDVVVGWHESRRDMLGNSAREGEYLYLAEEVKKKVKIPVMGGTRTNDLRTAEEALAQGKMDMFAMGRGLITDPELPNKAKEGRFEDIRPCICCCYCFDFTDSSVICSTNPRAGREGEYTIELAKKPKRVFIIGGGPGGMEAARVAAQRGHQVTLYEKSDKLGGQLGAASAAPYKELNGDLRENLVHQVAKSGVQVKLGEDVTLKTIKEGDPDVVILATGATPIIPSIPGVMRPNVVMAEDVLLERKEVGNKVVIIGGGIVGCETAELLAQKGKRITVVEMLERIATDSARITRFHLIRRIREHGVQIETQVTVNEISERGVRGTRFGKPVFFPGDTVVLAAGMRANKGLAEQLEGKVAELYNIGDSAEPGKIKEAILDGFLAGRGI